MASMKSLEPFRVSNDAVPTGNLKRCAAWWLPSPSGACPVDRFSKEQVELAYEELDRLLKHKLFRRSESLRKLLRVLFDAAQSGRELTEEIIAVEVYNFDLRDFHPARNATVRRGMSDLRKRLSKYYREVTPADVALQLPLGSYRLRVHTVDLSKENWRRIFGQAKLLSASRYLDELELALQRIDEVLTEQPEFAPAFALRSSICLNIGTNGGQPSVQAASARKAAERAMELAPDLWESLAASASVAGLLDWDWDKAQSLYLRAESIPGNEVVADPWYQATQVALDRIDSCLAKMRRALLEYPQPPRVLQQNYGATLHLARRWEEAETALKETTEVYPDDFSPWIWLAMQAATLGKRAKAGHYMVRAALVTRGRMPGTLIQSSRDAVLKGKFHLPRSHAGGAVECNNLFASVIRERPESAIGALERMVYSHNAIAVVFMRSPMQDYLAASPRFLALFDRMGIPRPDAIAMESIRFGR
jgi:tetratricopeptide (TPR) repeat protein